MAPAANTNATAKAPSSYFVDQKKGEVNELKSLLRNVSVERDAVKKREVIKKVIAYMTLGYDVSRLFGEIVMASSTSDVIVKKMCYLYLSNYAQSNEELATLVINTMTKDCKDSDPMIRGLALRSLSSLRLESTVEYLLPVLQSGLSDKSAYVRRNAVVAVLKLYHLKPDYVKEGEMIDKLYAMIRDPSPQVVSCCLMVLSEMLMEEGGIAINNNIIYHLLNQVKHFNEWGQCTVLDLVAKYRPSDQDETFGIMNILDGCLRVSNSAVVLGTTKCFLQYADMIPDIKFQVYMRLKQPMLTLMAGASHEIKFACLNHVSLMVSRCPGVFDDEFKQFYCHYNEPTHVKDAKLEVLPQLANEDNVTALVQELSEYVGDLNEDVSAKALKAIGQIAVKIPAGADSIINILLMEMENDYVRSGVLCVIRDLLRLYPSRAADVLPCLPRHFKRLEDPSGKTAAIFILGEYGVGLREAPYLLEKAVDAYAQETSKEVRVALLAAVAKLFCKRAPECEGMFGRLLQAMLNDTSDTDVHDRALLCFRLFRQDAESAAKAFGATKQGIASFTEERDVGLKQRLFEEFNSLSVLYRKPSEQFVDAEHRALAAAPFASMAAPEPLESEAAPAPAADLPPPGAQEQGLVADLLDFGVSSPQAVAAGGTPETWRLKEQAAIDGGQYQEKWGALPGKKMEVELKEVPASAAALESTFGAGSVHCMASGDVGNQLKFYFFAQDVKDSYYFAEVIVDKTTVTLLATIKGEDESHIADFENRISDILNPMRG